MFRFLIGIIFGFVAAVMILPLPGKTFFNKLSKLPKGSRAFVDDAIELGLSFVNLCQGVAEDMREKILAAAEVARNKADEVREELEENTDESIEKERIEA